MKTNDPIRSQTAKLSWQVQNCDLIGWLETILEQIFFIDVYHDPFCQTGFGRWPGGRLNKKDGLTRYGDSHVKDKTS